MLFLFGLFSGNRFSTQTYKYLQDWFSFTQKRPLWLVELEAVVANQFTLEKLSVNVAPSHYWATTAPLPEIQSHQARKNECLVFTFEYTAPMQMGQTFPHSVLGRNIDWSGFMFGWHLLIPSPSDLRSFGCLSISSISSTQLISLSLEGWPNMTELTQTQLPNTKRRVALNTAFLQTILQSESPTCYVDGAQPLILSSLLS